MYSFYNNYNLLESSFEFLSYDAIVFRLFHNFTDQLFLAVQILIVEFFIKVLEHGYPLDDVKTIVVVSIIDRSIS